MSTRYLVFPQVFSIANAFMAPAWFHFFSDPGCRQSAIARAILETEEDYLSETCGLIYDDGMQNASGLTIWNPNPCVVGVYGDELCKGKMIAYSILWDWEPFCFNLTESKRLYYASVFCLAPAQTTQVV